MAPKGKAPFVQFYPDRKSDQYQDAVADWARQQVLTLSTSVHFRMPLTMCRLLVTLRFNIDKPKSYPARVVDHTKKPDLDNLSKGILDGLMKGKIIVDDAMVTDLSLQKRYSTWDHPQGVEIDLTAMPCEI